MNQTVLTKYGLDEAIINAFSNHDRYLLARIIYQQKDLYTVISDLGTHLAKISGKMMYEARNYQDYPAVGDWVEIEFHESFSIIHKILPRRTLLERKTAGVTSEGQMIASNLDVVFICMSLNENFNLRRLERYLSVVYASRAIPIILLTKSDLTDDYNHLYYEVEKSAPNVKIIKSSALETLGYVQVKAVMEVGKTYAFIGSSGVGKSTLVNALLDAHVLDTYEVGKMAKGRHITTSRAMFVTQEGFIIIDTPGMRELQLDQVDFSMSFSDIETLSTQCKFNDCTHTFEPSCAVKKAIEDETLSIERLKNYQKMLKEAKHQELKQKIQMKDRSRYHR